MVTANATTTKTVLSLVRSSVLTRATSDRFRNDVVDFKPTVAASASPRTRSVLLLLLPLLAKPKPIVTAAAAFISHTIFPNSLLFCRDRVIERFPSYLPREPPVDTCYDFGSSGSIIPTCVVLPARIHETVAIGAAAVLQQTLSKPQSKFAYFLFYFAKSFQEKTCIDRRQFLILSDGSLEEFRFTRERETLNSGNVISLQQGIVLYHRG